MLSVWLYWQSGAAKMSIGESRRGLGAKKLYIPVVALCFGLEIWGCASSTQATNDSKTPVNLETSTPPAAKDAEQVPFVFFEEQAKTAAPPEVNEFVTDFFEAVKKDWRSGIRFMDPENYQEVSASNRSLDPMTSDASILVLSFSLHRFHGGNEPMDTDTDVQRMQAISKVRILKFEQNEQVFQLGGKTELKDGRVYGLTMVIAKGKLGILCPL